MSDDTAEVDTETNKIVSDTKDLADRCNVLENEVKYLSKRSRVLGFVLQMVFFGSVILFAIAFYLLSFDESLIKSENTLSHEAFQQTIAQTEALESRVQQGEQQAIKPQTIRCTSLSVVDEKGNTRAIIGTSEAGASMFGLFGRQNNPQISMSEDEHGGNLALYDSKGRPIAQLPQEPATTP